MRNTQDLSRKTCVLLVNGYCDTMHLNIENGVLLFNQYIKNKQDYISSQICYFVFLSKT